MKQIVRAYVVDEQEHLRRLPRPRYQRIVTGRERAPRFAAKAVRFVEASFGLAADGTPAYARAFFPIVHFDVSGFRDRTAWRDEERLALQESRCAEQSAWAELYRTERWARFRWQPGDTVLAQLRAHVRPQPSSREPDLMPPYDYSSNLSDFNLILIPFSSWRHIK